MILTHILENTTRTYSPSGNAGINVKDEHSVPFTFENFGERDYQIYEISCDEDIITLDGNDDLLTLPITVTSDSQLTIKLKFTVETRDFLPLRVFVTTTEQGRTNHLIRISEKIIEPIEEPTSELQVVGNAINLERNLDAEEVLTTKTGVGFNPYTITFDVKNIGIENLDIFELSFIDHALNKYDFTTIAQDGVDANCILNGADIGSGTTNTISFDIDLSDTGLFGTDLLPLHNPEEIARNGFDLAEVGYIYLSTNSLKSYYSPTRFTNESNNITINEGIFIIPIIGTLYVSSAIEILSNTEGTYDTTQSSSIVLENLIINTNRRTEQLIIKNYGIDSFNITNIESNYVVGSSDALSFYDYGTEVTFPLSIDGGSTKYLDIRFDNVQMIDDALTANSIDDIGNEISINKTFYKTITITTSAGVFNTNDNDQYEILVPFSIYKNQYISPYDWIFVESSNRMSLKDANDVFYSGATYELPYGYGLRRMFPSEQKVTQVRVKNNDLSNIKYFKIEIVDNNKYWKHRPYLVQGGIYTSVNKEDSLYFQLNPGEITGVASKDSTSSDLGDNLPILCVVQTNAGSEMDYEYMTDVFDEKYDLKKEGENIVIKVTEGSWVDEENNSTDGTGANDAFIEKMDEDSTTGYFIERSMVQYIVATWQPITFEYWSGTTYNIESYYPIPNTNEWVEFFRPRVSELYSVNNYTHIDPYYPQKETLATSQDIIPLTKAWSVSKVDPPTETLFQQEFMELYSNSTYSLSNLNTGIIDGEIVDFDSQLPFKTIINYSKNQYTIDYSIYPSNELLYDFGKSTDEIPSTTIEHYSVGSYSYEEGVVVLEKGDAVIIPSPDYDTRTHFSTTEYESTEEKVGFNWATRFVFSVSTYRYNNESMSLSVDRVQPPSFTTYNLFNVNNYTYADPYYPKKEELKLVAPERHIWYSLSKFFPVFDWTGDMYPQLVVEVVGDSVPKTIVKYTSNNYKFNFIPALVETGRWEVIKTT